MREIKFRGKRKGNGEWVYGSLVAIDMPNVTIWTEDHVAHLVDPKTVGQYTGLKDKNGKEIYEGDIVTRGDGNFKVIYKQDRHYIGWVATDRNEASYIHIWYDGLEVIGNIYEHPHLLKGGENA